MRWKGYGPESDQRYKVQDLGIAQELIKEYEDEMTLDRAMPDSMHPGFATEVSS